MIVYVVISILVVLVVAAANAEVATKVATGGVEAKVKEVADAEAAAKVAAADTEAEMKAADTMVEFMGHMMPAAEAEKRMRLEEGHYDV